MHAVVYNVYLRMVYFIGVTIAATLLVFISFILPG